MTLEIGTRTQTSWRTIWNTNETETLKEERDARVRESLSGNCRACERILLCRAKIKNMKDG